MPRIVDKQETKNKIMDAAMGVYADLGYHAATIDNVADAARISKGTVYLYFKSKEDLVVSSVNRILAGMERDFMGDPHCQTLEAFGCKLKNAMDVSAERAGFIRVFFEVFGPSVASEAFITNVADFFHRLGAFYADQIKGLQAAGEVALAIDADTAGRSLAAMVDGIILHRGFFGLSVPEHRAMIKEAAFIFINGLKK